MSVQRKRYRHLQRIPEVLPENPRKAFVYVRSQRVTDVQLLSLNGELHNHFYGLKRGGLPPFQHALRSEEHTSELQSLMRTSYDVFCLKKKKTTNKQYTT